MIPRFSRTQDWPRLVADAINKLQRGAQGFERQEAAPTDPVEGQCYYDLTTHKARCWDGTVWNDLW